MGHHELEAMRATLSSVATLYSDVVAHERIIERRRREIHGLLTGLAASLGVPSSTLGLTGSIEQPTLLRLVESDRVADSGA